MDTKISESYEDKMLDAFISNPTKVIWYKKSFEKYNVDGQDKFRWNWSWWCFIFSLSFLAYRRCHKLAIGIYFIYLLISIPLGYYSLISSGVLQKIILIFLNLLSLFLAITLGGSSTFLVYKRFKNLKQTIENSYENEETRIQSMKLLGGVNKWAPVIIAILVVVIMPILFEIEKFIVANLYK